MSCLIEAGCMVDGLGGEPKENVDILIDGQHIVAIGPRRSLPDVSAVVIPAHERMVLPGIIDAHVHIGFDASSDPAYTAKNQSAAEMTIHGVRNARDLLAAGVTTIRTLGTPHHIDFFLRDGINNGLIEGPRMIAAGRSLTVTGGHGHYYRIEADRPDEMREATRDQIKAGANVIKITVTGGVMTPGIRPGIPKFTLEEIQGVVREAHKAGVRVAVHAEGKQGVNDALAAGVDSIEHGYFMNNDEGLDLLLERGAYLVPTIMAYDLIANGGERGVPAEAVENARMALEYNTVGFRNALDAGAKIAMGSDAGTAFNDHGRSWRELSFMVKNGMKPMHAIVAATRNGADLLGLGERLGTLEVGKLADIIVVDGDPLSDIAHIGNVTCVIKGGQIVRGSGP